MMRYPLALWLTRWLMIFSVTLMSSGMALANEPLPAKFSPAHRAPRAVCVDGTHSGVALYRVCLPDSNWTGDLVIYAHGYVKPTDPLTIPVEATELSNLATMLGFGFATTSYRTNGLAVTPAISDVVDLVNVFETQFMTSTNRVYLVGASEGGLVTTLAIERHPEVFSGGLATCGPYGDFAAQLNHFGDVRVVFDYFFPGMLPGSPISIPVSLYNDWATTYALTVTAALEDPANTLSVTQLLSVTLLAHDPISPSTKSDAIVQALAYNVYATNDGVAKLGGQPFDNQTRVYAGSSNDAALNANIARFSADQVALDAIASQLQASGHITIPLVTMHTTLDPVVPYWHAPLYYSHFLSASDNLALYVHQRIERYGHCNFTQSETLAAFGDLLNLVLNPPPAQPVQRLYLPLVVR